MEFDRLADQLHRFIPCFADCHAAGQVGHVRAEGGFAFLENHNVFHHGHLRFLEASGVLERELEGIASAHIEKLSAALPGFAEAMACRAADEKRLIRR